MSNDTSADTQPPTGTQATLPGSQATAPATATARAEQRSRRRVDIAAPAERDGKEVLATDAAPERPSIRLDALNVAEGETLRLPLDRTVHVAGDVRIHGTLDASTNVLVLDGGEQVIDGEIAALAIILRGGTKRLRGRSSSTQTEPSPPGGAGLYVEENTTLVIEADAQWTIPNPYGFRVAGHLVIDGGTFECRFTNGNGKDRGEVTWPRGSALTIHSGTFLGRGDADFGGATVTIYDGELAIEDDLWRTGEVMNVYGGVVRNATRGGAGPSESAAR